MKIQLGVPITDEVLAAMPEEEQVFWVEFLSAIKDLILTPAVEKTLGHAKMPPELAEKYRIALEKYNGARYCQMQQIANIFAI